jgi:ubiquinone/menaquinone biosynthesis C-methylase UbiE
VKPPDDVRAGIDAVKDTFDANVESYSSQIERSLGPIGADHDFFMRHKATLIRNFVAKRFDVPRVRALDVGCGMGLMHRHLQDDRIELHGVDISRKAIEFAAGRNPHVQYHVESGERLPFDDGEFDLVFATNVLHHVPVGMWHDFLREMARVARSNRFVMVIEHNPLNPATRWVVGRCELDKDAVLLAPSKLRRLCRQAGLGAVTTHYILFTPFDGRIFRHIDDWLSRIPLGAQYVVVATKTPVGARQA